VLRSGFQSVRLLEIGWVLRSALALELQSVLQLELGSAYW
jgi:hypothetical protein